MDNVRHLMVDLETLSTSSHAAITQIGACFFDIKSGRIHQTFKVDVFPDFEKYDVSFSTIKWWMQQSDEARGSVFGDDVERLSMGTAAVELNAFISAIVPSDWELRVWAMPAAFDVVILENAFATESFPVPWKYNASRDVRTIMETAGFGKADRVEPEVAHDALSDAVAQAKTVSNAWRVINGMKAARSS